MTTTKISRALSSALTLSLLLAAATLTSCGKDAPANGEGHKGFPLDPALEAGKTAKAGDADTTKPDAADGGHEQVVLPTTDAPKVADAEKRELLSWDAETRRIANAMPTQSRMREPFLGFWFEQGFHALEDATEVHKQGMAAVRSTYRSNKTTVGTTQNLESAPFKELGAMTFEQQCEFVVIAAGDQAQAIAAEIGGILSQKRWTRGTVESFDPQGVLEIPSWSSEKLTAYVVARGSYVLYALERDGESEIGSGRSSSLGGQLLTTFLNKLN